MGRSQNNDLLQSPYEGFDGARKCHRTVKTENQVCGDGSLLNSADCERKAGQTIGDRFCEIHRQQLILS